MSSAVEPRRECSIPSSTVGPVVVRLPLLLSEVVTLICRELTNSLGGESGSDSAILSAGRRTCDPWRHRHVPVPVTRAVKRQPGAAQVPPREGDPRRRSAAAAVSRWGAARGCAGSLLRLQRRPVFAAIGGAGDHLIAVLRIGHDAVYRTSRRHSHRDAVGERREADRGHGAGIRRRR